MDTPAPTPEPGLQSDETQQRDSHALPATVVYNDDSSAIQPMPEADLPESIAHYRVDRLLGQGGMGVVYQAYDERLKRPVALKLLLGGHHHPEQIARFRAEAEAVARLEHPGIVRTYEVGQHEQQHYIALEYVEDGTLTEWIAAEPRTPQACARVVESMVRTIAYAHENDVIHRDLKPANALLDTRDTGIAGEDSGSRSASRTGTGSTVEGTSDTASSNIRTVQRASVNP